MKEKSEAYFVLYRDRVRRQYEKLKDIGLGISYSYKTNREVGDVLQELEDSGEINECEFSIHAFDEIERIKDRGKIQFFTQAESEKELKEILELGVRNFVVDNEVDFRRLLNIVAEEGVKIGLSLRMKFLEHRVGSGKYFVYGMYSSLVCKLIKELKGNDFIERIGVHLHRKTQNTTEWEIKREIVDSLDEQTLEILDFVNLGGGLPSVYKSSREEVLNYVFGKLRETAEFLDEGGIKTMIEPGRFIAAPAVELKTRVMQKYDGNLVINTTIYNCALDTSMTNTKLLVKGELEEGDEGDFWLIKGNSPTRDDLFRYRVRLKGIEVGDEIVFLNAGAYNYTTDFFGYKKLKTEIL